ncbi:hypothetical protein Taro_037798 [Colocasia esculenta]|uniref:Ubiquitin-like protease family profile domain-containing protein n=1 Tax=Colocasia esculenta TaxID=4460 RepID=A0A843W523_COLES|nr:hypothetical protein [Colocasia esculenta]
MLRWIKHGPLDVVKKYEACIVNGFRFHTRNLESRRVTPKVVEWIKEKYIFSKTYTFVTIVDGPCMILLDSLIISEPLKTEPTIRRFVKELYHTQGKLDNSRSIGSIPLLLPKVPQQMDGEECGVFTLYYIYLFLESAPATFSFTSYPYFIEQSMSFQCAQYASHLVGTEKLKANWFMDGLRPMFIENLGPHNIRTYAEMVQRAQLVKDTMAKVEGMRGKETTKLVFVKKGAANNAGTFRNNNKRQSAGQNSSLFCPEELGGGLWLLTQGQRHGRWTPSMIWASRDLAVESGLCRNTDPSFETWVNGRV